MSKWEVNISTCELDIRDGKWPLTNVHVQGVNEVHQYQTDFTKSVHLEISKSHLEISTSPS